MVKDLGRLSFLSTPGTDEAKDRFLSEVLTGWKRSHSARNFSPAYSARGIATIIRLCDFAGKYPWEWSAQDADQFFDHLRRVDNLVVNSIRAYQNDIRQFCEYAVSPSYDWNETCGRLFGHNFLQVINDFNKARHLQESDRGPLARPFSPAELEQFFEFADDEVSRILNSGRKGGLAAYRDSVAFKVCYAWGLRAGELRHLAVSDFSRNAKTPYFGNYGVLQVRHGKGTKGSSKKHRAVFTLLDWAPLVVDNWLKEGLPRFGMPISDLFPNERGGLLPLDHLGNRMRGILSQLGFPPGLSMHSLRRSYSTDMQFKHGYDMKFISLQLGHAHVSTTSIYSFPSPDFAAKELERILNATITASRTAELNRQLRSPRKASQ